MHMPTDYGKHTFLTPSGDNDIKTTFAATFQSLLVWKKFLGTRTPFLSICGFPVTRIYT